MKRMTALILYLKEARLKMYPITMSLTYDHKYEAYVYGLTILKH